MASIATRILRSTRISYDTQPSICNRRDYHAALSNSADCIAKQDRPINTHCVGRNDGIDSEYPRPE